MSVRYPDQWQPSDDRRRTPRPVACWHCGEMVTAEYPVVEWAGADGEYIVLHRPCAAELGAHLIGDAREAELAAGTEPRWHQRAARAALEPVYRADRERGVTLPVRSFPGEPSLLPAADDRGGNERAD